MSQKKGSKHKHIVHKSTVALLIIDMFNTLEFSEGKKLLEQAKPVAEKIARLKFRAKKNRIPVIYVNDNFGQWQSDWAKIYEICQDEKCLGHELALALRPEEDDYFVIKPKFSAFYSTNLSVLLKEMGVKKLILTGIATDICLLFSAHDAHVRNFKIVVPKDCTAAELESQKSSALKLMKKVFKIKIEKSTALKFR